MTGDTTDGAAGQSPAVAMDPRPRQLLERYTSLIGALLMETAEGLVEFEVPAVEQRHWERNKIVRLALTPEGLDEEAEAELLTLGSPAFERLLAAVRARGFRESRGLIPPTESLTVESIALPVALEGATSGEPQSRLTLLPVGRLLGRVSIKAGARLEERLVETPAVDLSTGTLLPPELSKLLDNAGNSPASAPPAEAVPEKMRATEELLPLLFGELERQLAADLTRLGNEADQSLKAESERLERYYGTMLEEVEPGEDGEETKDAKRVIRSELQRRRGEEEDRHRIRVTLHPLQLVQWQVLAQRVTWPLRDDSGHAAQFSATRLLTGATGWRHDCPSCGRHPERVRVCRDGHATCPECSERCGVCGETTCATHGLARCGPGAHAVCSSHARTCGSCGNAHCSTHSAHCAAGDHDICPACAVACGRCGTALCQAHGTRTSADTPRGARWLCSACTVLCEGGTNEPVGLDEALRCSSCDRHICETHRVACAVDGQPHCSRHLRRSDRSGRLACEHHRAACADEPGSVLASDEVAACVTCGKQICESHGGSCAADGTRHCASHLQPLADQPGSRGCEQHRTVCHVDQATFSTTGTRACPVCDKLTCEQHRAHCAQCARQVCIRDLTDGRCLTCARLEALPDPSDDLIQAALAANGGEPPKARAWKTARDASATVVELDLGWTRRLVFTVPHGETRPRTVVHHSLMGSKRVR